MVHSCIVPGGDTKEFFDAVEHGDVSAVARMLVSDPSLANAIDPRGKPPWARGEWPWKPADPCQPPAKLRLQQTHNALHVAASSARTVRELEHQVMDAPAIEQNCGDISLARRGCKTQGRLILTTGVH
jgi:hypothetical protein